MTLPHTTPRTSRLWPSVEGYSIGLLEFASRPTVYEMPKQMTHTGTSA